jgi:type II secretory pathway pseudopilin PulG
MRTQQGYTLLELLIILLITLIAICSVAINLKSFMATIDIEYVTLQVAAKVSDASREAIKGNDSVEARRFDLQTALPAKAKGVTLSNQAPSSGVSSSCGQQTSENIRTTCSGLQSICVEGRPFCYVVSNSITFSQYSGKLPYGQAVFVSNKSRKFAVLATTEGRTFIVEFDKARREWRYRD